MHTKTSILTIILLITFYFTACRPGGNFTGREYMPDMAHSEAYEPYTSMEGRSIVMADGEEVKLFADGKTARKPVAGTVARGFVPYHIENTTEGYEQAGRELVNPFNSQHEEVIKLGKEKYTVNCAVCHGAKGKGDGHIVQTEKYPAVPPDYSSENILKLPDGKMFHSIHYGKGMMGSYASQLTKEERWKVVSYIRDMQLKDVMSKHKIDPSRKAAALAMLSNGYNPATAAALGAAGVAAPGTGANAEEGIEGQENATGDATHGDTAKPIGHEAASTDAHGADDAHATTDGNHADAQKSRGNAATAHDATGKVDPAAQKSRGNAVKVVASELDAIAGKKGTLKKGQTIALNNVFFETASAKLRSESYVELNKLLQILKDNPNSVIELGGHTDSQGATAMNQKLSENRAKAVYAYLVSKNADKKQLTHKGYGSSKPVASNETEAGRAKNRRTAFTVIK